MPSNLRSRTAKAKHASRTLISMPKHRCEQNLGKSRCNCVVVARRSQTNKLEPRVRHVREQSEQSV